MFCRYIPAVEESVIGIVTERHSENFVVDICGPFAATLPVLSFEGATRRNRPNLQVCGGEELRCAWPCPSCPSCLCLALKELSTTKAQSLGMLWREAVLCIVLSCLTMAASAVRQE